MTEPLSVTIACKPLPKGRPRVVNGRAYTDAKTRAYETMLRQRFMAEKARLWRSRELDSWDAPGITGEVGVFIVLRFASAVHGDVDNCAKAILDAAQGVLFANDKCVRDLRVWRTWADDLHPEGFTIEVWPLADEPRPKKPKTKRRAVAHEVA